MQPLPPPPKLPPRPNDPYVDAMYDFADALRYPTDSRGRVYDVRFLIPVLSFHLPRVGGIIDPSRAIIKPRRLPPTPGVVEDAIEWVPLNTPDSIDDELAGVTIDDIDRLSPAARAELIRRLGGETASVSGDLDTKTQWHVETSIHFDDEKEQ